MRAGHGGDVGHVVTYFLGAVHRAHHVLHGDHVARGAHGGQAGLGLDRAGEALQHRHLLLQGGIAHRHAQEKTVHLRFGQGIGAHKFAGVLRGQHHEGLGQGMGHAVHRDLVFLHDLQQSRLRLGRGAVDLVRQGDLAHDRAGMELHLAGLEIDHGKAGHVAGHHVGRELDAVEGAVQRFRQGAGQGRLAGAGHVLDQHMSLAKHGDQQKLDHLVLADDDLADVLFQCRNDLARIEHTTASPLYVDQDALFRAQNRVRVTGTHGLL